MRNRAGAIIMGIVTLAFVVGAVVFAVNQQRQSSMRSDDQVLFSFLDAAGESVSVAQPIAEDRDADLGPSGLSAFFSTRPKQRT